MNKLLFTISNYKVIGMRRMGGGELRKEVIGVREEWSYTLLIQRRFEL